MSNMLPTPYQQFIHKSRYARWLDDEQRRENWDETVDRYVGFMENQIQGKCNVKLDKKVTDELREGILSLDVMPSMRAMMTAGPALARDNICGYNCSYIPVDSPRAFDECMYILMCGTGVGFSVERENVDKLPVVSDNFGGSDIVIRVGDSKPGWAKALRELIALLYAGQVPSWTCLRFVLQVNASRLWADVHQAHSLLQTCLTLLSKHSRKLKGVGCFLSNATT